MNNLNYKNTVLGLYKNGSLPYKDLGHIRYTNNTSLNCGTLNNTFNQLVDNDRFAERYLNGATSYQYGPKSDDDEKIYYGDNGYKYFKDENGQLAIYRKIEKDLNSDIQRTMTGNINFIFRCGSHYVCGSDSSLRYSMDLETWTTIDLKNVRGYYSSDFITIVAAQDGIYSVNFDLDDVVEMMNETPLVGCRSVAITDTSYMYVGCQDGVYMGRYSGFQRGSKIKFEKVEIRTQKNETTKTNNVPVNDIMQHDGKIYLAADDNVYKEKTENTLKGYSLWIEDQNVNCVVEVGDYTFAGTDENLFARYKDSEQFYSQFPHDVQVYSAIAIDKVGYFGTSDGLVVVDLENGILDAVEEYPAIDSLKNVTLLKEYVVDGSRRIYGINGTTSFYIDIDDSIYKTNTVLADTVQTDIHILNGKLFIATPDGLIVNNMSGGAYTLETIESLDLESEETVNNVFEANGGVFIQQPDYIYNVNDPTQNYTLQNGTINTTLYIDRYNTRYQNVILVFSDQGVKGYSAHDKSKFEIANTDNIVAVAKHENYYFAVVLKDGKYSLNEYYRDFIFLNTFDLPDDDVSARVIIDDGYLYLLQEKNQSSDLYRYVISKGNEYNSFDRDLTGVVGMFDNDADQLMIVNSDGIKCSYISSDNIDSGGGEIQMSQLSDVASIRINGIEHFGTEEYTEDDLDTKYYDVYIAYTPTGARKVYFESDGDKTDFSKCTISSYVSGYDISAHGSIGDKRAMLIEPNRILIKDYDFADLSVALESSCIYEPNDADLIYYENSTLIVKTTGNDVYVKPDGEPVTKLSCFTSDQAERIEKIAVLSDSAIFFTSSDIQLVDLTEKDTVKEHTVVAELTAMTDSSLSISYDTAVRVNYGDALESPYNEKILFGIGNEVYSIEVDVMGDHVANKYISVDKAYGKSIIGISQIITDGTDQYIWIFFKDMAIEYAVTESGEYLSTPTPTGREKEFYDDLKRGYVCSTDIIESPTEDGSEAGEDSEEPDTGKSPAVDVRFVILTEGGHVYPTSISEDYDTTDAIKRGVLDLIPDTTKQSDDGCYSFLITAGDNTLSWYNGSKILQVKEYQSAPWISSSDKSGHFVEKGSDGKLNFISLKSGYEYIVDIPYSIQDMRQQDSSLVFLIDNQLYYSVETDYLKFSGDSIKKIEYVDDFVNSGITKIVSDGSTLLAFTDSEQYDLYIDGDGDVQINSTNLYDIIGSSRLQNVVIYKNSVKYKNKRYDLVDQLYGVTRASNILYYCDDAVWYRDGGIIAEILYRDETYKQTDVTQIKQCGSIIAVSNKSGLHQFENGVIKDFLKSKESEVKGDIQDFIYSSSECFYKIGGNWFKKLKTGEDYRLPVEQDIKGTCSASGGGKCLICSDGIYLINYNTSTQLDGTGLSKYLVGTNIRKVYGSVSNLKLLVYENDRTQVRYYVQSTGEMSNPLKYTFDSVDADTGDVVPYVIDSFENIAFSEDMGIAVMSYNGTKYIRTKPEGSFGLIPIDISFVNSLCRTKNHWNLCTNDGLVQFDSYDSLYYFISSHKTASGIRYNKFAEDGDTLYMCSQYGIYKLKDEVPIRISQTMNNGEIGSMLIDSSEDSFLIPVKNCVYETDNIRLFKTKKFEIDGVEWIKQVFRKDSKNYVFVTSNGLYRTNYHYEISNDIEKFTIQDAIEIYEGMKDQIDEYYKTQYDYHVSQYHDEGSNVDLLANGYVDTNFDGIDDEWQKHELCSDHLAVENDMVFEIESSTNEDGDIFASASNVNETLSGLSVDDIPLTYILKRWKSGISELYIYLTTTNTYYLPFNRGVPNCNIDESERLERTNLKGVLTVDKANRSQNSIVGEHYTNIQLNILSSFCFMDSIHDIQINGNSLPLKIYKDREQNVDPTSQELYQSFIEPSVVDSCDTTKVDDLDYYNFKFKCFGSDSQAIRIQFYDSKHRYSGDSYIVEFDSNGGSGTMKNQRVAAGQAIKLRKNKFTKRVAGETRLFLGWSLTKQSDNTQPTFYDGDQFSESIAGIAVENGETVTLYAVWLAYNFDNKDSTHVVIESNKNQFSVKEARTFKADKIGENVVIDFGD